MTRAFRHKFLSLLGSMILIASFARSASAAGGIVYALNQASGGPNQIYGFRVSPAGALTPLSGFPVATGGNGASPASATYSEHVVYRNGRLFVVNAGSASLSVFLVGPSGGLTPAPYSPIAIGGDLSCVTVHPSGSPVIVGGDAGGGIYVVNSYAITSTTATLAPGSPIGTSTAAPFSCAFSRDGNYVYAGGNLDVYTAGFAVNPTTGVLTPLAGSPFTTGVAVPCPPPTNSCGNPVGYATDNSGRLFVSNFGSGVRVFTTSSGTPTAVTGNPFPSGLSGGIAGVLHPSGNFYMVADRIGNRVGVYRIAGAGSATTLTAVAGSPFATGGTFTDAVAASSDGALLVAANGTTRNLTVFRMDGGTGALASLGVQAANSVGTTGLITGMAFLPSGGTGDYDGDWKDDLALYRPSAGAWYILKSSTIYTTYIGQAWGLSTDIPLPGDYDGDGKADLGLYRASTGTWWVLLSSTNFTTYLSQPWGLSTDIAVPGDYDGDGKTDLGLYRPSTATWYVLLSSTNYTTYIGQPWGLSTDTPLTGDYDGDGKADLGLYRPSTGTWYVLLSSTNFTTYRSQSWGLSTDIAVPGDYDGDGKTDLGLYRPSTATWWVLLSSTNYATYLSQPWGLSTDTPVPGDYDGDGKTDLGLYRSSTGAWYILQSSTNYTTFLTSSWGVSTDAPINKRP